MKKFKLNVQRHICILLCFILYITVLPLPVSAEEAKSKTVRVGWYEGTYNTTGADGQRRGYSYEYQQAVAAHTGWKYEYVEGSWAELMSMLKNGQIDLLGGISYTEERSTSMLFSEFLHILHGNGSGLSVVKFCCWSRTVFVRIEADASTCMFKY